METENKQSKEESDKMILGFPREIKLKLLKDALDQNDVGMFIQLSLILLNAPISEGGIETEVIEKVHKDYLDGIDFGKIFKEQNDQIDIS